MTELLKRPLTWMVVGEALVVGALGLAAWHVYEARTAAPPAPRSVHARPAPPVARAPASPSPTMKPATPSAAPTPASRPGMATDRAFLARQAQNLNHDQASWEAIQWSLVHTAIEASRDYIERVVVPAVRHAEGQDGG